MSFERPTLEQIFDRIRADIETRLSTIGRLFSRSVLYVLAKALAGASHLLHGHLQWIYRQVFPDTAEAENLVRWASIWGIEPFPAEFAEGEVTFTGSDGEVIPEDTILQRADGTEFRTTESVEISGGEATAPVVAVDAGLNGNTDGGVILTLQSSIPNVDSDATIGVAGLVGGSDEESDESLLSRLLNRIQNPPLGGTEADYETWAKEVAGVTRAWSFSNYLGVGTVGTFFVRDDEDPIFPSTGEVLEVSSYIEGVRPVGARSYVFAPSADILDFEIELLPNTVDVQAAVEEELQDLILRDSEPGGTILLSRINEAISVAAGESDHVLISPTGNFVSATGKLATFGEVTWS